QSYAPIDGTLPLRKEQHPMSDLLIIAPTLWREALQPFVRYKNDTAMPATLLTIEEIEQR
ncbi:MAG: hypothetical protein KDE31_36630, partial [Caldilineaceae bacterium]|nr:hypothetical protein [Caldilineaceae bacterium]